MGFFIVIPYDSKDNKRAKVIEGIINRLKVEDEVKKQLLNEILLGRSLGVKDGKDSN